MLTGLVLIEADYHRRHDAAQEILEVEGVAEV